MPEEETTQQEPVISATSSPVPLFSASLASSVFSCEISGTITPPGSLSASAIVGTQEGATPLAAAASPISSRRRKSGLGLGDKKVEAELSFGDPSGRGSLRRVARSANIGAEAASALVSVLKEEQIAAVQTAARGWISRTLYREKRAAWRARQVHLKAAFESNPVAFKGLLRIQAYGRYLAKSGPLVRNRIHARRIAQEIIATEETYILALKNLKKKIIAPLLEPPYISQIPPQFQPALRSIIGNLRPIIATNKQLLRTLRQRTSKLGVWYWGQDLGSVFFNFAEYLKQYTFFINDYNKNLELLRYLDNHCPDVSKMFTQAAAECNRLDFPSLLIQPIQRIPRYVMLLSDLLKRTGAEHPHYARLLEARDKLSFIADHINLGKAEAENRAVLLQIQEKCEGLDNIVDPHRKFVREGQLNFLVRGTETKPCYIFLFNDLMLIGTVLGKLSRKPTASLERASSLMPSASNKPLFQIREKLPLEGWHLKDPFPGSSPASAAMVSAISDVGRSSPSLSSRASVSAATLLQNGFVLLPVLNREQKERVFVAPDASEKSSWMLALDEIGCTLLEQKKSRHATHPYPIPSLETNFEDGVEMRGDVYTRSAKSGTWQERRFFLKGDALYSQKLGLDSPQPITLFTPVISCMIRAVSVMDRQNCFEILQTKPQKKNVFISVSSNSERFEWIRAVRLNIERVIDQHIRSLARETNAIQQRTNAKRMMVQLDPAIEQVLEVSGNDTCADCTAPEVEWVCLSRGVFLCATCGSIHRRLSGQAIISLTRGRWSAEKIRQLQGLPGNALANELYEKHLPSDVQKPSATSSNTEKTKFIQLKYTKAADSRVEQALVTRQSSLSGTLSFPPSLMSSDHLSPPSDSSSSSSAPHSPKGPRLTTADKAALDTHLHRRASRHQEGWLLKRTSKGGTKQFYATLRRRHLALFGDEHRKKKEGSISLVLTQVFREPDDEGPAFKLITTQREHVFIVKSVAELESWLTLISKNIENLKTTSVGLR